MVNNASCIDVNTKIYKGEAMLSEYPYPVSMEPKLKSMYLIIFFV
jgi:hypothetical protein